MYKSPEEVLNYVEMPESAAWAINTLLAEIEKLKSETTDHSYILEKVAAELDTIIEEKPKDIINRLKSTTDYIYSTL